MMLVAITDNINFQDYVPSTGQSSKVVNSYSENSLMFPESST